jgi:hypothetical protein
MVTLENTWTKSTAVPSIRPLMTVVEIPTAGHIESANLNIGFSLRMPFATSCKLDFSVATIYSSQMD